MRELATHYERVSVELAKPNGDVLWRNNKLLYPERYNVADLIGIDGVMFLTSKRYWKAPAAKCDP